MKYFLFLLLFVGSFACAIEDIPQPIQNPIQNPMMIGADGMDVYARDSFAVITKPRRVDAPVVVFLPIMEEDVWCPEGDLLFTHYYHPTEPGDTVYWFFKGTLVHKKAFPKTDL